MVKEGRGKDGGTWWNYSQRATTRLFNCLYIIGRTDGILLLLDVKERKQMGGSMRGGGGWNFFSEIVEVFSLFFFFFGKSSLPSDYRESDFAEVCELWDR